MCLSLINTHKVHRRCLTRFTRSESTCMSLCMLFRIASWINVNSLCLVLYEKIMYVSSISSLWVGPASPYWQIQTPSNRGRKWFLFLVCFERYLMGPHTAGPCLVVCVIVFKVKLLQYANNLKLITYLQNSSHLLDELLLGRNRLNCQWRFLLWQQWGAVVTR